MRRAVFAVLALVLLPFGAVAQDQQTLADIRQELNILYVEVQKLRRELSTTGSPTVATGGQSVLDRMVAIESEVQRLTSKTEELEFRINKVVEDGTNRIGDLEFRLVELEGGDVSVLGQTTTLGGDVTGSAVVGSATAGQAPSVGELAVGEETDFRLAQEALSGGDFQGAAEKFAAFNQTYPGGPLAAAAELGRGQALEGLGDTREAARAYLASFSAQPNGQVAPQALFRLGRSLGLLGQTQEACVTLGEVGIRFPADPAVQEAQSQMQSLGCS